MLRNICLKNFKCFSSLDIALGSLNVFSGINGMGKSSVLQSLLLLKQSSERGFYPQNILLNGEYVGLGTGKDILYENAEIEEIAININSDSSNINVTIPYISDADILAVSKLEGTLNELFDVQFEYLNAERLSPKTSYEKSSYYVDIKSQLGVNGQYTAHYLAKHQDDILSWKNCDSYFSNNTLRENLQFWLNEISPNIKLNISEIEYADLAQINYYFGDASDAIKSNKFRPTNIGFGVSYCLPVITAALKAEQGSILIIENPEAHLHPKGQRKIGELLAKCACNGTQVFLETHSDHVMNGIRIAVKRKVINCTDVKMYYFEKNIVSGVAQHTVQNPQILENGKLNFWPDGFFDEWEKSLDEII
jgi:Uncharacterized conserved protein